MTEAKGPEQPRLFQPDQIQTEKGGERDSGLRPTPERTPSPIMPTGESDSLGDVHRAIDEFKAKRGSSGRTTVAGRRTPSTQRGRIR